MIIMVLISDGEGVGCPVCAAVKLIISQAQAMLKAQGIEVEIQVLDMDASGPDGEAAVDFAIDHELTLVPSTVVGKDVFEMDELTAEEIVNAVKRQEPIPPNHRDATRS